MAPRRKRKRVERVPYVSLYPSLRGAVRSMESAGIDVNRQQLGMFLRDRSVERELQRVATEVARSAGPGFIVPHTSRGSGKRTRVAVVGHTYEAIRGERKDKRLTNALNARRTTPVRPRRPKQNPDPPGFNGETGAF